MKNIFCIVAIASALSFAASEPKTHDGFFLSFALGMGYQAINFVADDGDNLHSLSESGAATDIDVKIGGRIANNTLLHLTLAGTTKTGTVGDDDYYDNDDIKANMSLLGLGVTYYFSGNFFATGSIGISQFHANSDVRTFDATVNASANTPADVNSGFGFQVGGGKEWWVSDNWGIGASAALLFGFANTVYDDSESSLGITLRLTATWN